MVLFEWTLALLLGAVLVAALARRLEVPYPTLLALAGAGLAFLPFAPAIEIEPDLALALFVAPVLLDAAFDTSPRDLKRYALSLASLAFVAVVLTTSRWRWSAGSSPAFPWPPRSRSARSSRRRTRSRQGRCCASSSRRAVSWPFCRAKACSTTRPRF